MGGGSVPAILIPGPAASTPSCCRSFSIDLPKQHRLSSTPDPDRPQPPFSSTRANCPSDTTPLL